jgi:hypothetical protein
VCECVCDADRKLKSYDDDKKKNSLMMTTTTNEWLFLFFVRYAEGCTHLLKQKREKHDFLFLVLYILYLFDYMEFLGEEKKK